MLKRISLFALILVFAISLVLAEESKQAFIQTKCPVTGNLVDRNVYMDFHENRIFFENEAAKQQFINNLNNYVEDFVKNGITFEPIPISEKSEKSSCSANKKSCCKSSQRNGGCVKSSSLEITDSTSVSESATEHKCSNHKDGQKCTGDHKNCPNKDKSNEHKCHSEVETSK